MPSTNPEPMLRAASKSLEPPLGASPYGLQGCDRSTRRCAIIDWRSTGYRGKSTLVRGSVWPKEGSVFSPMLTRSSLPICRQFFFRMVSKLESANLTRSCSRFFPAGHSYQDEIYTTIGNYGGGDSLHSQWRREPVNRHKFVDREKAWDLLRTGYVHLRYSMEIWGLL